MRLGICVNPRKKTARPVVLDLVAWLKERRVEVVIERTAARALRLPCGGTITGRRFDLILALGGDGTLLRAARTVGRQRVPILGINLGGLGFLTGFAAEEARPAVDDFLHGRHRVESRMLLTARLGGRTFDCLNDFVLTMGPARRIIELALYIKGEHICRFVGDGLIVATPTGSTAYSVAAGGPILYPDLRALVVTPISPHALAVRPLVLPPEAALAVEVGDKGGSALLVIDGQQTAPVGSGERVVFTRARHEVRLVVPRAKSFYEILRTKMKWGGRDDA